MGSNDPTGELILKTLLQVAAKELEEEVIFSSYKAVLGLVIRGGLQFALGPIGYALPFADLIAWMTKIGAKTVLELPKSKDQGTLFQIRSGRSGILIVENIQPVTLRDFPIQLPDYLEITRTELVTSGYQASEYKLNLKRINSKKIFEMRTLLCGECKRSILSHAPSCSKNPNKLRYPSIKTTCEECGRSILSHAPLCSKNPNKPKYTLIKATCDECGQSIWSHALSCSKNPNKPFRILNLTCDQCGQSMLSHAKWCPKNLNKPKYTLIKTTCDECSQSIWNHTARCSKNPNKATFTYKLTCIECGWSILSHAPSCSKNPNNRFAI